MPTLKSVYCFFNNHGRNIRNWNPSASTLQVPRKMGKDDAIIWWDLRRGVSMNFYVSFVWLIQVTRIFSGWSQQLQLLFWGLVWAGCCNGKIGWSGDSCRRFFLADSCLPFQAQRIANPNLTMVGGYWFPKFQQKGYVELSISPGFLKKDESHHWKNLAALLCHALPLKSLESCVKLPAIDWVYQLNSQFSNSTSELGMVQEFVRFTFDLHSTSIHWILVFFGMTWFHENPWDGTIGLISTLMINIWKRESLGWIARTSGTCLIYGG